MNISNATVIELDRNTSAVSLEPSINVEGHSPPVRKGEIHVCHHWKSKGFCKMGDHCKFSHPENKKGVKTEKKDKEKKEKGATRNRRSSGEMQAANMGQHLFLASLLP